jgi:hypothetical protein
MVLDLSSLFASLAAHLVFVVTLFAAHFVFVVALLAPVLLAALTSILVPPLVVLAVFAACLVRFWLRAQQRRGSDA